MSGRWSGWMLIAVGGAALACGGFGKPAVDWPDETTWTCGGGDVKTLTGVKKELRGKDLIAIDAGGNCQLTLVDCDLTADFGIKAAGNARIMIQGGRIHGNQQAIQAWGSSLVTIEGGAMIEGEQATTGSGRIVTH